MPATPYTERLGVPRPAMGTLAERYRKRELKLIDLLVAVLLERGGPAALLDPDVERRLKMAPVVGSGAIALGLDLDELEELAGSVAFAANHADDEQLQHRLDIVHDRMATVERWAVN